MPVRSLVPSEYYPTASHSGNEGGLVYRMQNLMLRGERNEPYAEVYGGSLDLGENIADSVITGTVALTINNLTIIGTGTLFKTELHLGQRLMVYGGAPDLTIALVVDSITDNTHFIACRAPYASTTGATCTRLPRLYEVNKKRGTSIWGNAVEYDLGTIIGVGDGTFRLNGAVLSGTSLTLTRAPKIAVFNSGTGNYSVYTLGMATPATLTAAVGPAGTKNMQAGQYSIRAVPARVATRGYNNPSPKAEVTLTVGNKIRGTFPAADTANGQDAWMIFGSQYTQQGGINGPWNRYQPDAGAIYVLVGAGAGQIAAAGGTYDIEYNDAEISVNDPLTFNNDPPPNAEFVSLVGGRTVFISTDGPGNTSPGPFIAPVKINNVEAAPATLRVSPSPPDTIIGFKVAQGRLYLMCVNTLQIAIATQTTDSRIPPLVVRPHWASGFKNPDTLLFVDGFLVGMTNHGMARSLAEGDESREEFGFATAMVELLQDVSPGHCLLALDPKNNAICLFSSAHSRNATGFWTTRVWMYGLREGRWIGDILLTNSAADMIVCGAATVNGQLEFLCGGRSGAATVIKTYRWDTPDVSSTVPWYIAWQFSDWGVEDRPKHVGPYFQVVLTAPGSFPSAGIYGAESGQTVSVATLEAGNHSTSFSGTILVQGNVVELNIDNLRQFTVRLDGTWFGGIGVIRDRIDEVVIQAEASGARR